MCSTTLMLSANQGLPTATAAALSTQESGSGDSATAKASSYMRMGPATRELGSSASLMAKESSPMSMGTCMKATGRMGRPTDGEPTSSVTSTWTAHTTRASGKMTCAMDREKRLGRTAQPMKVSSGTAKSTVKGCIDGRMAPAIGASGKTIKFMD